jgi:hypothetical protein
MVASFVGVRQCKALLAAVADCDVTAPKSLTALTDAFDALGATSAGSDPMAELVKRVAAAGGISGKELNKLIADAATERMVREFRTGLIQHVEGPIVKEFVKALEGGSAEVRRVGGPLGRRRCVSGRRGCRESGCMAGD